MFDEEVGKLVKLLGKADIDWFAEAGDEDDVRRVAEMFNEDVGWLIKKLNKRDVDLFADAGK